MALIKCPECKKEVSDSAISCPHCGFSLEPKIPKRKWYQRRGIVVLWLFLFAPVGLYGLFRNEKFGTATKAIFGTVFSLWVLLFIIAVFAPSETETETVTAKNDQEQSIESPVEVDEIEEVVVPNDDPLNLGKGVLVELIGNPVPYEKWDSWGDPETLTGTNNTYWVVYLPKANISFVSDKAADTIIFADFGKEPAPLHLQQMVAKRTARIEEQFSAWDGSHRNLTSLIKKSMNDPKSYEHVETVYWDQKDYLIIQTKFRGKNAFGGMVLTVVEAKVSLEGEILEILDQY